MTDNDIFDIGTRFHCRAEIRKTAVAKMFIGLLVSTAYFLPLNSLGFNLTVGLIFGSIYYILCKNHSSMMMFICMIVHHQKRQLLKKLNQFWTNMTTFQIKKKKLQFRLQNDDNFNFLEYYDVSKVGSQEKKYIYLFNEKLRSNDLIIFKDESNRDITDDLEPYLGPMQDFHGVKLTPADFNHKKITIFRDGELNLLKTFEEFEPMVW